MKVLSAVLLLGGVLVGYVYGQTNVCPKLPDFATTPTYMKEPFKKDEFIKIDWKEIKTIDAFYAIGGCVSVKYAENKEKTYLTAAYKYYDNNEEKTADYVLKWSSPQSEFLDTFDVYDKDSTTPNKDGNKYQILVTDNKNYAVVYGCKNGEKATDTYKQRVSVLSSTTSLEPKLEGVVEFVINALVNVPKFDAENTWTSVEQDSAKCKNSASIFAVSTILNVIVVLLALRN